MDDRKVTLLQGILAANRLREDRTAEVDASWDGEQRPFIVTCMDPRLKVRLMPDLGLLNAVPLVVKTAGAIVRGEDRSTFRSILAGSILQKTIEVLVIGHTDCAMKTLSTASVRSGLGRLRVPLEVFGAEDPLHWFGHFVSDRTNVQMSVEALRRSPLLPESVPIHGLMYDLETGRLELVVEGYGAADVSASMAGSGSGFGAGPGAGAPGAGWTAGPVSLGALPNVPGMSGPSGAPPSPGLPPPDFGTPGPGYGTGPVSLEAPRPDSLMPQGSASGFAAPPPPPPAPVPPPDLRLPPPPPPPPVPEPPVVRERQAPPGPPARAGSQARTNRGRDDDDDTPPAPPSGTRRRVRRRAKRSPGGDSPFDEAQKVLERLRRERR